MPVTFFICFILLVCFDIIVLNANPKPKDAATAMINNVFLFIWIVCYYEQGYVKV